GLRAEVFSPCPPTRPRPSAPSAASTLLGGQPVPRRLSPFFFLKDPATTEIYTLSLHDALPILKDCWRLILLWFLTAGLIQLDQPDRKSTRLNSSHVSISYAVFCLKKKKDQLTAAGHGPGRNHNPSDRASDGPLRAHRRRASPPD